MAGGFMDASAVEEEGQSLFPLAPCTQALFTTWSFFTQALTYWSISLCFKTPLGTPGLLQPFLVCSSLPAVLKQARHSSWLFLLSLPRASCPPMYCGPFARLGQDSCGLGYTWTHEKNHIYKGWLSGVSEGGPVRSALPRRRLWCCVAPLWNQGAAPASETREV